MILAVEAKQHVTKAQLKKKKGGGVGMKLETNIAAGLKQWQSVN